MGLRRCGIPPNPPHIVVLIFHALTRSDAPPKVQKYVLKQLCETLPLSAEQQKAFVSSGSLEYVQQLNQTANGKLQEHIETLNSIFPPDVVEYYTPGYVLAP